MKFFRTATPWLVVLALLLCVVPVFASEVPDSAGPDEAGTGEVLTDGSDIPAPAGDNPVLDDTPSGADGDGPVGGVTAPGGSYASVVDVGGAVVPAGGNTFDDVPADSGTLPGFLRAMFGEYAPKTQTVTTYFDGQPLDVSTEYVPGLAGLDMEWIASVVLFGMVVYCLFRLLGGIVR